jgi:amino acid transporter
MRITKKHILATFLCLSLVSIIAMPAVLFGQTDNELEEQLEKVREEAGYRPGVDLVTVIGVIINVILGLLGVVAVIIIVIGGFKWMTAGGNDEKIKEAKRLIGQGVIGLIIVLAAYAIARFIIDKLKPEFLE